MPNKWARTLFPFHLVLASCLALWVYLAAGREMGDPDIWWHLRNAQYLLTQGKLPRVDMYSFTALGYPWIDHQWLAEIPYYLAWQAGGLVGIYFFSILLLETILLGNFYWAYRSSGNLKGSFVVSCLLVFLAKVSFGPRTLLFGYFYLLILLLVLGRFRSRNQDRLWILPPLFCLWVNTHGSWLSGLMVFAIFVVAGLVEGTWGRLEAFRWSPQQLRKLMVTGGLSAAALFLNPFGYRLVLYPFDLIFRQKLNVGRVEEWASVNFNDGRGKVVFLVLVVLLLGALMSRQRWKLEELGLAGFALYLGLSHVRFLFLAAILLSPLLAKFLDFFPPYRPEIDKPLLNVSISAAIFAGMIVLFPSKSDLENVVAEKFPANALVYVKSHGLPGRVFNYYSWGGYITWHDPEVKTFLDSRADIFEYTGVFKDYLDATDLNDSLRILDKYQIRFVLLPSEAALSYMLEHHADWMVVFKDKVAILLERVGSLPGQTSAGTVAGTRTPS